MWSVELSLTQLLMYIQWIYAKVNMLFRRLIGSLLNHSVQYHWGRAYVKSISVFLCCLTVCQGLVIQEGHPAEFNCSVERIEISLWQRERPDGSFQAIAQGGKVYSWQADKFRLNGFNQSGNENGYLQLLTLNNGTAEDDGLYRCEEDGQVKTMTNLIVEIPPVLHLEMDNTIVNTSVDVVSNQQIAITCIAERSKPPVRLSWMVNDEVKSGPFIEDLLFSSERKVTSILHYIPTVEDNTLTCVASGQQVIPEQKVMLGVNVQYKPNCVMAVSNTTNAFVITCSCKANPKVDRLEIYVNGSIFSTESKTTLPSEKSATVFCSATNKIDNSATEPQHLKAFHEEVPIQISKSSLTIWLTVGAIILLVLITIAVVAVVKYRQKRKDALEAEADAMEAEADAVESKAIFDAHWNQEAALMASTKPLPPESVFTSEEDTPLKEDSKDAEGAKNEVTNETVSPDESPTQEEGIPLTEKK